MLPSGTESKPETNRFGGNADRSIAKHDDAMRDKRIEIRETHSCACLMLCK